MVILCQMMSTVLSASAVVKEKEMGTLEQLYMTPVRRGELILGKMSPYAILTVLEFCLIATLMRYAFAVPIRGVFFTLLALPSLYYLVASRRLRRQGNWAPAAPDQTDVRSQPEQENRDERGA